MMGSGQERMQLLKMSNKCRFSTDFLMDHSIWNKHCNINTKLNYWFGQVENNIISVYGHFGNLNRSTYYSASAMYKAKMNQFSSSCSDQWICHFTIFLAVLICIYGDSVEHPWPPEVVNSICSHAHFFVLFCKIVPM